MPLLKTIALSAAIGVTVAFSLSYLIPGFNGAIAAGAGAGGAAAALLVIKYFKP